MALYENVNGVIKEITAMSTNVGGTLKNMTLVHENVNGTLKQVFPKVIESKYKARIQHVNADGPLSGPGGGSSTGFTTVGELKPGVTIDMSTSASASGATYNQQSKTLYDGGSNKYVYITSNCKLTVNIQSGGSATFSINGVTKFDSNNNTSPYIATFNLTPNDYIAAYSRSGVSGSAGTSTTVSASVTYTLSFT